MPFVTRWIAGLGAALVCIAPALADTYPSRPVTLIVPFAPGASADGLARLVANELSTRLGQTVVVENRPGAGGATGLMALARATPDGYTLSMGATGAIAVNPHIAGSAPLNPEKELAPVAKLADIPLVFVTGAKTNLKTPADLQRASAATAGGLSFGTTGANSAMHLSGELFNRMTGSKMVHIAYKGSAPAVTDVLAGNIPLAIVDLTSAAPHIKAGTLLAVGTTSPQRVSSAPEIPTLAEAGLPGYAATAWMGIFAPAGIAPEVSQRISDEIGAIMAKPEVQERARALGTEPAFLGAKDFGVFLTQASNQWRDLVKSVNP